MAALAFDLIAGIVGAVALCFFLIGHYFGNSDPQ
jgi:hypothetical protein